MRDSILRRAAAVVVAVCVGITFVPLAGEYDVYAEGVTEDTETVVPETPETEGTEPTVTTNEPAEEPETDSAAVSATEDEPAAEDPNEEESAEPEVKNGKITEDGVTYYYKDGEKQSGLITIDGALYYFDPATFAMRTGAVNVNGALYYFFKDGKATTATSWFKGDDSSTADRFGLGGGKIQTGVRAFTSTVSYKAKVKKRYKKKRKWRTKYVTVTKTKNVTTRYFFDKTTGRLKPAGFFKDGSNQYYSYGGGKLATGWTILDNKAYYFNASTGVQAINTTVGYLKIPASGYLGEAYVLGIKKLNSTGWSLKQAYKNSYKIKYQGRWWRQKTSEQYALKGFKYNKGNCYVMAATFYIQAKLLGYNVRQIHGKVAHRAPHSWTQIKTGGKWKVYDPNFKNETRRNGWNIYYGKKGTWRYTDYSTFQN